MVLRILVITDWCVAELARWNHTGVTDNNGYVQCTFPAPIAHKMDGLETIETVGNPLNNAK